MNKERVILILGSRDIYEIDVADETLQVKKCSLAAPMRLDTLITFQPDELISQLGVEGVGKVDILDFECLDKQIRQSLDLKAVVGKWNAANMIATYLDKEERKWKEEEYEELLKELTLCYREMKVRGKEEWQRIKDIEIPVNKILFETQAKGIYFNHEETDPMCGELHRKLYGYKNKIQLELGYTGDDLISYLNQHDIDHHLRRNPSDTDIKHVCKLHPEVEPFWKVKVTERNLRCLLLLSSVNKDQYVCRPVFKGFASTTGRIFLRDPALQNLSKKFRLLLKENLQPDWRYEYIDFGQFEAGILAAITQNEKLQKLYEEDKIYESLARMTQADRETAKIYFYCFIYGGVVSKGAERFFSTYNLKNTVDNVINEAIKQGYVCTPLGNKRVIKDDDDRSWILNHYIQGTSSLIFKQALINVKSTFYDKVELVLPVHDAALFKVHKDVEKERIISQFKAAFVKWLPGSRPVIKEKDFFEGEK